MRGIADSVHGYRAFRPAIPAWSSPTKFHPSVLEFVSGAAPERAIRQTRQAELTLEARYCCPMDTVTQARMVDADTALAFDLYHQLPGPRVNAFFSPYSIATALTMTYAGARGLAAEATQRRRSPSRRWRALRRAVAPRVLGRLAAALGESRSIPFSLPQRESRGAQGRKGYWLTSRVTMLAGSVAVVTVKNGKKADPFRPSPT